MWSNVGGLAHASEQRSTELLPPHTGSYAEALSAFRRAQLAACLRVTRGREATPARVLRARAFLRLRRPAEARSALRGLWLENDVVRGEVAMLQSAAAASLGERATAAELLLTARAYVFSTDAPGLEAEVEYYSARAALHDADPQQAAAACRRLLRIVPSEHSSEYVVPLRHVRARAFQVLGYVRAAPGNYAAQVPLAFKALAELRRSRVQDAFEQAHHVACAAGLVCDFDLRDRAAGVRSQVEALRWTRDTADLRFKSRAALGWCAALRGDHFAALRYFRRAGEAPTLPQAVCVGVARTSLAYELDRGCIAGEEIGYALDLAERYEWERARGDDYLVLLSLAQAAAPLEPVRARAALERYVKIATAPTPSSAPNAARIPAEEAFAQGVVARAEANVPLASHHLRVAFERWNALGFTWRAARAAIELSELGGDDVYREYVRQELAVRPLSWFAKRAAATANG